MAVATRPLQFLLTEHVRDADTSDVSDDVRRPDHPPHTPSDHAVFLRGAADGEDLLAASQGTRRMNNGAPIKENALPWLVVDQPAIGAFGRRQSRPALIVSEDGARGPWTGSSEGRLSRARAQSLRERRYPIASRGRRDQTAQSVARLPQGEHD